MILNFITSIGKSKNDTEEFVLQKNFMISLGLAMSLGGVLWGSICLFLGLYLQCLIPYAYTILTIINFYYFNKSKNFTKARFVQVLISLLLPFAFQFVMGGFVASGGVMLWSIISLITALTFINFRTALYWLFFYLIFTILMGVFDAYSIKAYEYSKTISSVFFVINFCVISTIVFGLSYYFTLQRNIFLQKAAIANKSKSEFLANMSHEIRTPLNGVIGFADLLMLSKLNDTQQQYMNTISQSANSLLDIINDILDFSKIEAGKLELSIEKIDLLEISKQVGDMVKYQTHNKGLELLLNISNKIPRYIWTDDVRLKQILINLLSNAVKFTEFGEIELKIEALDVVAKDETIFRFSVRDSGVGIDAKNFEKIFEAFVQEDSSTTKKFGGTGLGLNITNKLLGLMNSTLKVESELGKGSVFYFDILCKSMYGSYIEWDNSIELKNVLIIDDNKNNRTILKEMLAINNITCDEAKSGKEAIELLKVNNRKYDVLIMDHNMPMMNGIQTTQIIRETLPSIDQPIILLYTSADDNYINKACEDLNISLRLLKPVNITQLYNSLSQIKRTKKEIKYEKSEDDIIITTKSNKNVYTVLIAEDHKINMLLAKTMLKSIMINVRIIEAKNGREAVDLFKETAPDLVLLDIQMPELNGYDTAKEIRLIEINKRTPIIALTAGTVLGEKEKCIEVGMDDYISKPFVHKTLEDIIFKWLG